MVRRIAVLMTVLLAVSACDSPPADGDDRASSERTAAASPDNDLHRTRTGLRFRTPPDWSTKLMPAGARLFPPAGTETRDDYLLVIRFAPDATDDATDGSYIDELAADFSDRISNAHVAVRETGLDNPMGPASYVAWNIPQNGWVKRVGFFVVIADPWMLVLRATGPRRRLEQRRPALESIFASARLTDADIDPRLVGTWRRTDPRSTPRGRYRPTMTLHDDGTVRLVHRPIEASADERLEAPGRWATSDGRLIRYLGDRLRGGVQLETQPWQLADDGQLLRLGDEPASEWRRLPSDQRGP